MVFNQKTEVERYTDVKMRHLKVLSSKRTFLLGFLIGCMMILLPLLVLFIILFLPRIIEFLVLLIRGGNASDEIFIIQRFTRNWSGWLLISLCVTFLSSIIGSLNAYVRKVGFDNLRARGFYLSGKVPWFVISFVSTLLMLIKIDFSFFGIIFLGLFSGWFFRIPFMAYYLYLEDFYFERFVIKDWD